RKINDDAGMTYPRWSSLGSQRLRCSHPAEISAQEKDRAELKRNRGAQDERCKTVWRCRPMERCRCYAAAFLRRLSSAPRAGRAFCACAYPQGVWGRYERGMRARYERGMSAAHVSTIRDPPWRFAMK